MLLISFSVGFLLKPLLEAPYKKKYLPYMVCVYEGGNDGLSIIYQFVRQ